MLLLKKNIFYKNWNFSEKKLNDGYKEAVQKDIATLAQEFENLSQQQQISFSQELLTGVYSVAAIAFLPLQGSDSLLSDPEICKYYLEKANFYSTSEDERTLCAIIEALLLYHSSGYSEAGANQALEKLSSAKVTGKEAFRLRFSLHLEINDLSSCAKLLSEIEADENNSRQLKTPPWLQLLILYQARCGNFSATEESIKILLDETQLQANYFLVVGSAQQQLAYRQFQQVCQSYTLNPYLTIGIEVKGLIDRQLLTLSRENFVKAFKFFKEASCNGETKNSLLIALSTGLELDLLDQDDLWQQLKILAPNTPLLLLEETLDIAEEKINDLQFLIARIEQLLVQPEGNPTFINQWCYLAIE